MPIYRKVWRSIDSPNYWEVETTTPPTLVTMLPSVSSRSNETRCLVICPMYGWLVQNNLTDATYRGYNLKMDSSPDRHNPGTSVTFL